MSLAVPFFFSCMLCMKTEHSFSTSIQRLTFLRKLASSPSPFLPLHPAVDKQIQVALESTTIPGHSVSKHITNWEGFGARVMWREQGTLPSMMIGTGLGSGVFCGSGPRATVPST